MARKTDPFKKVDARIDHLYGQKCSGIQVDIFDLSKITKAGREAIVANPLISDDDLGRIIYNFVQTIRKN